MYGIQLSNMAVCEAQAETTSTANAASATRTATTGAGGTDFESGKAVSELNQGTHHDHLVCMQCGRVEEFYDAEIEKRQIKVASERGFKISEHALYLYADCTKPRCPYRKAGSH